MTDYSCFDLSELKAIQNAEDSLFWFFVGKKKFEMAHQHLSESTIIQHEIDRRMERDKTAQHINPDEYTRAT